MKNKTLTNKFELEGELEKLNCHKKLKLNLNFKNYKKFLITTLMLEEKKEELIIFYLQERIGPYLYKSYPRPSFHIAKIFKSK